jgi:hypothetical protein
MTINNKTYILIDEFAKNRVDFRGDHITANP